MTRARSLLAATALMSVSAAPAFAAWPYNSIVSFGDSLSDVGNVYLATSGAEPAPPYYQGRFSNGPIWLDDLAKSMGLSPLAPSLAGGTDFAWGGATTGYSATNNSVVPNLEQQVQAFNAATGGVASPHALYTFSIGANDLFAAIDDVSAGTITFGQAAAYAQGAAQIVANEASVLQQEGATDLVLFDVPDLSKTPAALEAAALLPPLEGAAFLVAVQGLSAYFDSQVLGDLGSVEQGHNFAVYNLDVFSLIDTVVADPGAYGFSNVTDPCYVGALTGGGTTCADPGAYLFWDHEHPTTAAGTFIAADAYAKVVPEPSTWAMMVIGFAGLGLAGARAGRRAPVSA